MIAQHSSASNEHYTPPGIVDKARALLGGFDLDPASCDKANETVKAEKIWTIDDDGLSKPWYGRVFLNPPGGKLKRDGERWIPIKDGPAESSMLVYWKRLTEWWRTGDVPQAFFVAFTLELLRTSQYCDFPAQAFPRCYPKSRMRYVGPDGKAGGSPTHANMLIWLPPKSAFRIDRKRQMAEHFADVGCCEAGYGC